MDSISTNNAIAVSNMPKEILEMVYQKRASSVQTGMKANDKSFSINMGDMLK